MDPDPYPAWELIWDRPNARTRYGPRDRGYVYHAPLPSAEVWTVVWVWSTLLTLRQEARRRRNIVAATEALSALRQRLANPKARRRTVAEIDLRVAQLLERYHVTRYLKVRRGVREEHRFKQSKRGRPGAQYGIPQDHPSPPRHRVDPR